MARARNIKPGFYQNDLLAECSVWARLLFPGLWMLADRDGKLEDRPNRIKAAILPYDNQNVDKLLTELHNRGFIFRYSSGGFKYILIMNFGKHQNPHAKEAASTIPDPEGDGCEPAKASCESSASPVLVPNENRTDRAESLLLNPESPSLIPESLDTDRFRSVWVLWIQHRKEIKKPLKPAQEKTQLAKLAAEGEADAVERIEKSIANGWQGLWFDESKQATANGSAADSSREAAIERSIQNFKDKMKAKGVDV